MAQTAPRGRITWHELMTTDADAAIKFYTKVVGWTTAPFDQTPGYTLWMNGKMGVGGVMKRSDEAAAMGAPPQWLPYMAVADVDNTVHQAEAMGARTLVPGTDITVGRFAVMADPQGATFGLFATTGDYPGHDGVPTKGEFSWHELATTDPTAAWHFYHQLFGWEKMHAMDMGPDGIYQMWGRGATQLGGMYKPKPSAGIGLPHWVCYARVTSADGAVALIPKLGGRITSGPMEVPGGDRIAIGVDPQGAVFAVHSVAVAAAKPAPAAAKPAAAAAKPAAATAKPAPAATKPAPAPAKPAPAAAMPAVKKAAPATKNVAATKKPVAAKKQSAPREKVATKKKPAAKKRAAPKKKTAARKKPAAKKRPAARTKATSKRKPVAKKTRRR